MQPEPDGCGSSGSAQERVRLQALHALQLLDTPPEPEFDDLVHLAAAICGSSTCVFSLVDEHRLWLKASLGIELKEVPRDIAFCHYTVQQSSLMLVEDAQADPRFSENPIVQGEDGWRFYAGMPVQAPGGSNVGTLCVFDRVPRTLTADQQKALEVLAGQVNARLELRMQRLALQQALRDAQDARSRAEALEKRFETFMDSGPFLAYIKDPAGRMLYYNDVLARQFGASRTALLNKLDNELWPSHLAESYREHDLAVLRSRELRITLEETAQADGSISVWRSFKFPCADADGQVLLGGVSVEVTEELRREVEVRKYQAELELANRRLADLASIDALTGLPNRRTFDEQFRIAFRQARSTSSALSVLMLDVDHFKRHNDLFGHAHGDEVLRLLGACLRQTVRAGELAARFGGEEFAILLPGGTSQDAATLANRILETVRHFKWPRMPVTASIGVSTLNPATRDTHHLLGRADDALYAAKAEGRNRVVSFSDEIGHVLSIAKDKPKP